MKKYTKYIALILSVLLLSGITHTTAEAANLQKVQGFVNYLTVYGGKLYSGYFKTSVEKKTACGYLYLPYDDRIDFLASKTIDGYTYTITMPYSCTNGKISKIEYSITDLDTQDEINGKVSLNMASHTYGSKLNFKTKSDVTDTHNARLNKVLKKGLKGWNKYLERYAGTSLRDFGFGGM